MSSISATQIHMGVAAQGANGAVKVGISGGGGNAVSMGIPKADTARAPAVKITLSPAATALMQHG